jgi:methionyl-tRNA synthetase
VNKKIFIGVAWPYVNGDLHIGHLAGYLLPADICARFNKLAGNEVLMISGSDCFGTPITLEADKKGVSPTEIVETYHEKDVDLFLNVLNLSYSLYTKTDNPTHKRVTQELFLKMLEKDLIFIDSTQQYFSPSQNRFLPDRYVIGICPFCGAKDTRSDQCDNCGKLISTGDLVDPISNMEKTPVIVKETEHYFIDWPKFDTFLSQYVHSHSSTWKDWVKTETLGWLNEGLQPRAITRDIDWGVELPIDQIPESKRLKTFENKRFYVWFDAVTGYLSGSILWAEQNNEPTAWKEFWYGDVQHYYFMGKDNLVFHTLFWPGQLHGYDEAIHLPDLLSINMFLHLDGKKFSKSRGVSIDTKEFVEKFGNDSARFYLSLIMPENKDANFVWSDFEEKNNGVLVGNIGNLIHRVLSLSYGVDLTSLSKVELDFSVESKVSESYKSAFNSLEKCEFKNYIDELIALSGYGNKLVDSCALWSLKNENPDEFIKNLKYILFVVLTLIYLLEPVVPHAVSEIKTKLQLSNLLWNDEFVKNITSELNNLKIDQKPTPVFKKIELDSE